METAPGILHAGSRPPSSPIGYIFTNMYRESPRATVAYPGMLLSRRYATGESLSIKTKDAEALNPS
jgi:hypothetical protein